MLAGALKFFSLFQLNNGKFPPTPKKTTAMSYIFLMSSRAKIFFHLNKTEIGPDNVYFHVHTREVT